MRSSWAKWAAAAAAVTMLCGCVGKPVATAPVERTPVPPLAELSAAQVAGLTSLPWTRAGTPDPGQSVVVQVADGNCVELKGVIVSETAAAVTVQVFARVNGGCTASPNVFVIGVVHLATPLGTRSLLHGPATTPGR